MGLSVDLAREADLLIFARYEPARDDVKAFWSRVRVERRRLARDTRLLRRIVAFWSPRALLHGLATRRRRPSRLRRLRPRRAAG